MAFINEARVRTTRGWPVNVVPSIAVVRPRAPAFRRMAGTQARKLGFVRAGMMICWCFKV